MKRGDVVIAGERGSYAGKPRPWIVVQNDQFLDEPWSITVCVVSSTDAAADFRVAVEPHVQNGLRERSLILADKLVTIRASAVERIAGSLDRGTMMRLDAALRSWLDL